MVVDETDGALDFPPDWWDRWRAAHARIDQAGYGETVARAYRHAGPQLARRLGPDFAVRFASSVSTLAIRSGRRAAGLLVEAALQASAASNDRSRMDQWLQAVEEVAKRAPDAAAGLLQNSARLLEALDMPGFLAFVRMGLGIAREDKPRRLAFFSLESAEARRLLDHRMGAGGFQDLRGGLKLYLGALWGISPPIAEAPAEAPEPMTRRSGFGSGGIRLPSSYAGFSGDDQKALHRASLAHIGAHYRFTRGKFRAAGLKPLQLALVSLIEDARVERLAAREMPGLFHLWNRFHVVRPEGPPIAIALMARLARALLDPAHADPHGWVEKGRALFEEAVATDAADQQLSRRIGGLLGNDIGQMRLQFDAKTYVVQPAYRDDNLATWDFGDQQSEAPVEIEAMAEGARMEQQDKEDGRQEEGGGEERRAGHLRETAGDEGVIVARYPEYDYVTAQYRPDWCTVREWPARSGSSDAAAALQDSRSDIVDQLSALIGASRISRQERVHRQPEGEFLDMDASISAMVSRRAGEVPDARVYGRYERRSRDMSVLVLIDASRSTNDRVRNTNATVLETERLATAFMARAMAALGDPFAIAAFCSDGREDVRYMRIKDFERPFDEFSLSRLAGLKGELSTRLGAVMRHAGRDLLRRNSHRRLLLVVTDGEPSDVDVEDRRYLVEDARVAVHELNHDGIDVFCVALDSEADSYTHRIFGRRGALQIDAIDSLPRRLPALYLRLRG